MTPERWRRIQELYDAAVTRDERDRASFLAEASADDESLRREVESLLAQPAERFLADPAIVIAATQLASPAAYLATGDRIGVYEVTSLLGRGGMGEVYRAHDTRLRRDVALKILPRELIADPDRLARFEREARMLAALNHPHIATLYGIEEAGDVHALVLELVEGPTLAERLERGPLSITESVAIARQIAEALEAAHERGIVHRDLKPANIKVTRDGVVKVLDFGLAKAVTGGGTSPDLSTVPTVTIEGTRDGVILGTPAYLSPEQARGQALDKRTDIWSFGCVLYQMCSGQIAFSGHTISDTIAAILERQPDFAKLPAATPRSAFTMLGEEFGAASAGHRRRSTRSRRRVVTRASRRCRVRSRPCAFGLAHGGDSRRGTAGGCRGHGRVVWDAPASPPAIGSCDAVRDSFRPE